MSQLRWLLLVLCISSCGGPNLGSTGALSPQVPESEGKKCKIASSVLNPLVTEWPASEKARLEALAARGVVAVEYSGCEMRIVDRCQMTGAYTWKRTTLASDTIEIGDADELYAKLPLGAVSLEGQLARSGRLAVKTTVAGQLEAAQLPAAAPASAECETVTHFIKAISVGTFRLVSGGKLQAGIDATFVGGKVKREESLLREAGNAESCAASTDEAPDGQCASPIQVFLAPAKAAAGTPGALALSNERGALPPDSVNVTFSEREGEHWSVFDVRDNRLCVTPCTRWVPPASGVYLLRHQDKARVEVPARLADPPGSHVRAEYKPDRGAPLWATITFYGLGVPAAIGGTVTGILAIGDEERRGFFLGASAFYLSISLATAGWYFLFSDWEQFETTPLTNAVPAARHQEPTLGGRF